METLPHWQWQKDATKMFSDICPNCKCTIEFNEADSKDLDNTHDNGKGGKCRFRGVVQAGKFVVNLHLCPECHEDKRYHHIACKGECAGARHCRMKFSVFFTNNKNVNGKQQCDVCVASKGTPTDIRKKCNKCKLGSKIKSLK